MRIDGIIAATCFILLHRVGARDERECEESVSEKFTRTIDGIRFHLPANSTWCGAPDEDVLFYRSVIDLIPKERLTDVPVGSWATLCSHFSQDVGFVSRVLDLLKNDGQLDDFLNNITVSGFAGNPCSRTNESWLVQIIAEDLVQASVGEENALHLLLANRALLFSAPSYFLSKLNDNHKTLLIYVAAGTNSADAFWMQQSPLTRRSWSTILLQTIPNNRFASFIKQQANSSFFQVLDTINMTELQNILTALDGDRTFDPAFLRSVNWNSVQIRKIVDFNFQHLHNSSMIEFSDHLLSRLLPVQIASSLAATTDVTSVILNHLRNVDEISLPQALQLFECVIARLVEKFSATSLPFCAWVGKLLYSQTNTLVSRLYDDVPSKLNMTLIKCSDSDKYSLLQRHYIFGRHFGRNELQGDEIDGVLNVKGLLVAIPASFYIKLVLSSERHGSLEPHFGHILKYFPARANKMAAFAAFRACKILIAPSECVKSVLENSENEILSTVSPFYIREYREEIWHFLQDKVKEDEEFKRRIARFPSFVLTELLDEREDVITYLQLFNETYPSALVISGLDCEILSRIPSCEFLPIFQFYNEQRKLYNKEFPKDLQKCAQRAFLRYLRVKSNVGAAPLAAHLLQYLDLADIRSIGGYVLATLPATSIAKSKHGRYIVAEIGRLSLPELLLAVTRSHLVSITSQYLKDALKQTDDRSENDVRLEHLTTLGNLTHFLDDKYVRRIDPSAFKFLLEAEFFDTRICAPSSIRKAWANKLFEAFGSPAAWDENTLLRIGDMLVVLHQSSFHQLNATTCSRAVDSIKSKYTRFVQWIPRSLPFYQVCSAILLPKERLAYQSSIQRLALFYAKSIQLLLRTIVPLAQRNTTEVVLRIKRAASFSATEYPSSASDSPPSRTATATTTPDYHGSGDDGDGDGDGDDDTLKTGHFTPFTSNLATSTSSGTTAKLESGSSRAAAESEENQRLSAASAAYNTSATSIEPNIRVSSSMNSGETDEPSETTPFTMRSVSRETTETTRTAVTDYQSSNATFSSNAFTDTITGTVIDTDTDANIDHLYYSSSSSSSSSTYDLSMRNAEMPTMPKTEASVSSVSAVSSENVSVTFSAPSVVVAENFVDETSTPFSFASSSTSTTAAGDSASRTSSVADDGVESTTITEQDHDTGLQSSTSPLSRGRDYDMLREYFTIFATSVGQPKKASSAYRAKRQAAAADAAANSDSDSESQSKSESWVSGDGGAESLNVSCSMLRILDTMSDFIASWPEVKLIETEAFDCIELLARMDNLTPKQKKTIWSSVASKLSNENLTFVAGKILSAVDEGDLNGFNMDVRSPGALELIGALSQVLPAYDGQMVENISRKILKDNNNFDEIEDALLPVLTRALGRFMCQMPEAMFSRLFERLQEDGFAEWTVFDGLDNCPVTCLRKIANTALAKYGNPREWSPTIFTMLGPVVAAIPNVNSLIYGRSPNITRYFSASALACLLRLSDHFNNHTDHKPQFLHSIPLTSAMVLLEEDCVASNYRDCAFTTSLADVILTEDSLSLESKINSSHSSKPGSDGASISPSFLLLLFLLAFGKVIESCHSDVYCVPTRVGCYHRLRYS